MFSFKRCCLPFISSSTTYFKLIIFEGWGCNSGPHSLSLSIPPTLQLISEFSVWSDLSFKFFLFKYLIHWASIYWMTTFTLWYHFCCKLIDCIHGVLFYYFLFLHLCLYMSLYDWSLVMSGCEALSLCLPFKIIVLDYSWPFLVHIHLKCILQFSKRVVLKFRIRYELHQILRSICETLPDLHYWIT